MNRMTAWAKEEARLNTSRRLAQLERLAERTARAQGVTVEELLRQP